MRERRCHSKNSGLNSRTYYPRSTGGTYAWPMDVGSAQCTSTMSSTQPWEGFPSPGSQASYGTRLSIVNPIIDCLFRPSVLSGVPVAPCRMDPTAVRAIASRAAGQLAPIAFPGRVKSAPDHRAREGAFHPANEQGLRTRTQCPRSNSGARVRPLSDPSMEVLAYDRSRDPASF
jgi:hypothetical protein